MPPLHPNLMAKKIALFLLTTSILLSSFSIVALPQAHALTINTWDDSHTTARFGNSKVCGDHLCAKGEHEKWVNAVWQSQKVSQGKIGKNSNGEDVMHKIADTTPAPSPTH